MKTLLALLSLAAPTAGFAADSVALSSAVFVERIATDANGRQKTVLEAPVAVTPGDRLVFFVNYRNAGATPARDFVVTNPMPAAVAFQGTPDRIAEVSIDGGRSWGQLGQLSVTGSGGSVRGARPEDVTHVRWVLKGTIPAGMTGKLSFRGVVR